MLLLYSIRVVGEIPSAKAASLQPLLQLEMANQMELVMKIGLGDRIQPTIPTTIAHQETEVCLAEIKVIIIV
jgi:hypothetical protein